MMETYGLEVGAPNLLNKNRGVAVMVPLIHLRGLHFPILSDQALFFLATFNLAIADEAWRFSQCLSRKVRSSPWSHDR
jgi:hypothetical protein